MRTTRLTHPSTPRSNIHPFKIQPQRVFESNTRHRTHYLSEFPHLNLSSANLNNVASPIDGSLSDQAESIELKKIYSAAILSEVIYKAEDLGQEAAEQAVRRLESLVPIDISLGSLSWAPARQRQCYVTAETDDTLYVAFLGTKRAFDIFSSLDMKGTRDYLPSLGADAKVHKGYVARAASVPAEQLWRLAAARGRRLVFCGHSMGSGIAQLCTLRLLSQLPEELHHTVSAVGFATPPLGNQAVAQAVQERGWENSLHNFLLPEDWVPQAMTLWQNHSRGQTRINVSTTLEYEADSTVVTSDAATVGTAAMQARIVDTSASEGREAGGGVDQNSAFIRMKANWWFCWGYGERSQQLWSAARWRDHGLPNASAWCAIAA